MAFTYEQWEDLAAMGWDDDADAATDGDNKNVVEVRGRGGCMAVAAA